MKPKEFDGLVRKKFDQNDFAYNPGNWDKLAEKLDGKEKKRSLIMWWWVPLAGMAASVIMAMGVTSMMHQQSTGVAPAQHSYAATQRSAQDAPVAAAMPDETNYASNNKITHTAHIRTARAAKDNTDEWFAIKYENATTGNNVAGHQNNINLLAENNLPKKKKTITADPMPTFKPDVADSKPAPKLSVILSGGVNHGNQNSGYMACVSIRRMLNDKVYVEGDVAFAESDNTQSDAYMETSTTRVAVPGATTAAGKHSASKSTALVGKTAEETVTNYAVKNRDISYNVYYAQVTPSIGYKIMKKMSIGVGPDFQQMLVDNRPAPSTADRGNIQEAPIFDVGFIGKTEYALTKKVKAAVYYRKGVNDVISTSDRYINRDYIQFQVKCVIFNK